MINQNGISQIYGNKVKFFCGDGLNISSEELGYQDINWRKEDKIEFIEYDRELGNFTEYYTIYDLGLDEDNNICAKVYYSGSSLDS